MRSLAQQHRLPSLLVAFAVLLGAVLRLVDASTVRHRTPDELVYTAQAERIARKGPSEFRAMAQEYIRSEEQRLYPNPSRLGYTSLVAAAMNLTGRFDVQIGAWVSTLASVACLGVVAATAVTYLNPWVGAAAAFILGVFPPDLMIARRSWTDSLVSLLTCVILFCALGIARGDRHRWLPVLFLASGAVLAVTKESALVVWGLAIAWIIVRRKLAALPITLAAVVVGVSSLLLIFWAIGGIGAFLDIQSGMASAHLVNEYALQYQSGPPVWIFKMFWIASPMTLVLALAGIVLGPLVSDREDRLSLWVCAGFSLIFVFLPFVTPSWLNLRYASPAFGPLCLLAGAGFCSATVQLRRLMPPRSGLAAAAACTAALGIGGYTDYRYFERWFVTSETPDLSAAMVLATSRVAEAEPHHTPATMQTAAGYLDESLALYQQRRFEDSIIAARRAIELEPGYAAAYNNVAAAYAELGRWDDAIRAAEEALRFDPDMTLARNNLNWARAEKVRAQGASTEPDQGR